MSVPIFDPANYALSPYAGPPLVGALLLLALGLLVLIREGGSRTGMLFFVLSLTISIWLAAFSVMYTAKDAGVALWWARAAYLGTPFIPAAIYHFMVTVLRRASLRRRQVAAAWVTSAAFCGLALLTDVLITGVQRFWWGYYPRYGWGSLPFLAFFFGLMIAAFRMLWVEYRDTPSATHKRRQALFMAALGIGYLASVDFLAKFGLPLYPFGYLPLLGFAVVVAFATDRYRMIDLTPAFAAAQILNTMQGAVLVTDLEGRIRVANPNACLFLKCREEELLGLPIAAVCEVPTPMQTPGLTEHTAVRDQLVAWRTNDGRHVDVSLSASVVVDKDGAPSGIVYVALDLTDRLNLEGQLRQSQKMEAIGRLAGGIAHDFNNLLTIIIGYSQALLSQLRAGQPYREEVEQIQEAGQRAATLTRQLLAFSRRQMLMPKVLNLNAAVADIQGLLQRLLGEDIDLSAALDADLGLIKADPSQLEQVLMNLAVNAREAMPHGGRLTIETSNVDLAPARTTRQAILPGPYVLLSVTDTGSGMDEETQARIFEPFFTTKEQGKGTGLGLATVYGIIKQSHGYIFVNSEPGKGTSFQIYLPRVETAEQTPTPKKRGMDLPGGVETVLLVEDEPGVRGLARTILTQRGYRVLEARHGVEALLIGSQYPEHIDLLLTDVVMPQMSGREVADRLKPTRPGMKVLYMSGYADEAVVHHGLIEPGQAFLQKPFTIEDLAGKVRQVLDAKS